MSQTKLTKAMVRDALAHFRKEGDPRPGLHKLRQYLQCGSLALLKRLRDEVEEEGRVTPGGKPIPDQIQSLVNKIWNEMEGAQIEREQALENDLANDRAAISSELDKLREQLQEVTEQNKRSQKTIDQLTSEISELKDGNKKLELALEKEKSTVARANAVTNAKNEQIASLERAIREYQTTLREREQQFRNDLNREKAAHSEQRAAYEKGANDLRRKLDQAQHDLAGLKSTFDSQRSKLIEETTYLNQQLRDSKVTLEKSQKLIKSSEGNIMDLQEKLGQEEITTRELKLKYENAAQQIVYLESSRDLLRKDFEDYRAQSQATIESLQKAFNLVEKESPKKGS